MALPHANIPQSFIEFLQLTEKLDSFGQFSRLDIQRSSLLVFSLIGQDVGFENIGIDFSILFEFLRILDGEFPERKVFQPDEAFLRNLKILILECLNPEETKVVVGHAQTGQLIRHRILFPLNVLDERG